MISDYTLIRIQEHLTEQEVPHVPLNTGGMAQEVEQFDPRLLQNPCMNVCVNG